MDIDKRYSCEPVAITWYEGAMFQLEQRGSSVTLVLVDTAGQKMDSCNILSITDNGLLQLPGGINRRQNAVALDENGQILTEEKFFELRDQERRHILEGVRLNVEAVMAQRELWEAPPVFDVHPPPEQAQAEEGGFDIDWANDPDYDDDDDDDDDEIE